MLRAVLASGLVAGVLLTAATSGAQDPPSAAAQRVVAGAPDGLFRVDVVVPIPWGLR